MFKPGINTGFKFRPSPYKPEIGFAGYRHRAVVKKTEGDECIFYWHWPRGTFEPRMSAYEIASFLLPHMPSIAPALSNHPRERAEFEAMMVMLATSPRAAIDEILPWIKPLLRTDDNDIIVLQLGNIHVEEAPKKIYTGAQCH